jgi:hypothetical protein
MSDEFDSLDVIEKAAVEAALSRCRVLARQIEIEVRKKRSENFVDKRSLADFYASLEHAADVLGQKGQRSVENTTAPVGKARRCRTVNDNWVRSSSPHALARRARPF